MFQEDWIDVDEHTATNRGNYGSPEDPKDDFINEIDTLNTFPDFIPQPRRDDGSGNHFVTIVDMSGVHYLPVVPCDCQGAPDEYEQYLKCNLFPSSFQQICTAFTLEVLKDFHMLNLECKTSAYQYYSKLCRITCPVFPKLVINQYHKLRCLSRQFCNLKLWKIHGRGHTFEAYNIFRHPLDPNEHDHDQLGAGTCTDSGAVRVLSTQVEAKGSQDLMEDSSSANCSTADSDKNLYNGPLTLFCPTCPQPGINLPADWAHDPNKWLYTRTFCADGNFKADHMNQRNEYDDVSLFHGEAFMTAPEPYKAHLKDTAKHAKKYAEVSFFFSLPTF